MRVEAMKELNSLDHLRGSANVGGGRTGIPIIAFRDTTHTTHTTSAPISHSRLIGMRTKGKGGGTRMGLRSAWGGHPSAHSMAVMPKLHMSCIYIDV